MVDELARRYARLPHEILALDPWELSMAVLTWRQAKATGETHLRRILDRGGSVQPVVVLS